MSTHSHKAPTGADPAAQQPGGSTRLTVIGIGASAGGLAALRTFFGALPGDTGLTFVVVVHLSPEHESNLATLLQAYTAMPVLQVTAQVQMQPDHVYVIPPGKQLMVSDSTLDLAEFAQTSHRALQIDTFFRSLAAQYGDGGAIILSGSGSDGAVGIQAIKEGGGLVLVQDPAEAEYEGMPRSAVATGLVDIVAPVAELALQLVTAKQTPITIDLPEDGDALSPAVQQSLTQILAYLRAQTGHDFSGYKPTMLLRRLVRRLQLNHLTTLTAYLHHLRQDHAEAEALLRDLLINVTAFFRDPTAWAALEATVIPQLFAGKGGDDTVRVWSVGCASGEEAYSIAMLLLEAADQVVNPPTLQIFASDLDAEALAIAREGCYPAAIAADVGEQRLARFFTKDDSHYRVRSEVREIILFAQHNLLQDPPFSRLDLILCRNVLIYLQRDRQEQIVTSFAYALREGAAGPGYLFLGHAEASDSVSALFDSLDRRHRLYQRHTAAPPFSPLLTLPLSRPTRLPAAREDVVVTATSTPAADHRQLLEDLGPPSLLVDESYTVLHLSASVGRYLLPPGGTPTTNVLRLVRPELQAELRVALARAFATNQATATRPIPVHFDGTIHLVSLLVRPQRKAGPARALIFFWADETPSTPAPLDLAPTDNSALVQQLEAEVQQTHHRLHVIREEYETTVEELRAANEELQSANEEHTSLLEELETSKEELQSMNEELQTVNQELKNKVEEVSHTHGDLQNLFAATDIATLFLDRNLRIKRYTPRTVELFNLTPPDRGRPLTHLRTKLDYGQLEADAQAVLAHLASVEREVQSRDDRWFLVRIRPYRTVEDYIEGVVITCVDITTNKQAAEALRRSEERYRLLVESTQEYAMFLMDPAGQITSWNMGAQRLFGYTAAEAIGVDAAMIFTEEDRQAGVPTQELATAAATGQANDERWHVRQDGSRFWASGVMESLHQPDGSLRGFAKVLRDNTERKTAEEALQRLNATLEQQVEERTAQVRSLASTLTMAEQEERRRISQILHDDLQQQLYGIQMRLMMLQTEVATDDQSALTTYAQDAYDWLGDAIQTTRQLTVDLSPPVLKGEGLVEALGWLTRQMAEMQGLQVALQIIQPCPVPNEDMRVLLFQSVRELLFNVVKHAGTDRAAVALNEGEAGECIIIIRDEGRGFDVAAAAARHDGGFGLFSVRERLKLFGGRMAIQSAPGQGTAITIHAPSAAPAA
ncbi:MAG: CheR family methyltransferase [Caldilineaceae bacterium]